jgi:hypothetical protein
MKKIMTFMPVWFTGLGTWVNKAIQRISEKENLCSNCDRWYTCCGFKVFEKIKKKFGIKFIITRCKRFQNDVDSKIRRRIQIKEFFEVMIKINSYTEGLREKQCMCINSCCNLNIKDHNKNCPAANELYDACVKFNTATIVFSCPICDVPQKLV